MKAIWLALILAWTLAAQQTDWITQIYNKPFLDARSYNWAAQSPGVSLTASTPATITLTPCPSGINSLSPNHNQIWISGGTGGSAEAVLLTSFSAATGHCSVGFTPANSHAGSYTVQPAVAGVQEAIHSLPAAGGTVWVCGLLSQYGTLYLGNGTSSANATQNNIALVGCGWAGTYASNSGAVRFLWAGATGGTMLNIQGPVQGIYIPNLYLDGNAVAGIGVDSYHLMQSYIGRLQVANVTTAGINLHAYNMTGITSAGAGPNTWEKIEIVMSGLASNGITIGDTNFNTNPFDVARNYFRDVEVRGNSLNTGNGIEFRFTDSLDLENLSIQGWQSGCQVKFTPTTGNVNFPAGITFRNYYVDSTLTCMPTVTITSGTAGAQTDLTVTSSPFSLPFEYLWVTGATGSWVNLNGFHHVVSIPGPNHILIDWDSSTYGAWPGSSATAVIGNYVNEIENLQRADSSPDTIIWPAGPIKGHDNFGNWHNMNRLGIGDQASASYRVHVLENYSTGGIQAEGRGVSDIAYDLLLDGIGEIKSHLTSTGTWKLDSVGQDTIMQASPTAGASLVIKRPLAMSIGGVLTVSSNAITVTQNVHHVGAGLIKTINGPADFVGPLYLIPDAAFTYDATGNIVVPSGGGTAEVNKLMVLMFDGTKWTPSY